MNKNANNNRDLYNGVVFLIACGLGALSILGKIIALLWLDSESWFQNFVEWIDSESSFSKFVEWNAEGQSSTFFSIVKMHKTMPPILCRFFQKSSWLSAVVCYNE